MSVIEKVISGGQTGVDRAALDVARELGIASGGWCPQGRRSEDGPLADCYPMQETPAGEYAQRTEWNVRDADGTLVLTRGRPSEGTAFTIEMARRHGKPCLVLDVSAGQPSRETARAWAHEHGVRILNVAGPRESKCPGIYEEAKAVLRQLLVDAEHTR